MAKYHILILILTSYSLCLLVMIPDRHNQPPVSLYTAFITLYSPKHYYIRPMEVNNILQMLFKDDVAVSLYIV